MPLVLWWYFQDLDVDDGDADMMPTEFEESANAGFASQSVYARPSAYIASLIQTLPAAESLTKDQTLFMARFAEACDAAWEDEKRAPHERHTHHILLLGAGGSGKTHVVQRLVFKVVSFS